eukprot:CFRG2503T1
MRDIVKCPRSLNSSLIEGDLATVNCRPDGKVTTLSWIPCVGPLLESVLQSVSSVVLPDESPKELVSVHSTIPSCIGTTNGSIQTAKNSGAIDDLRLGRRVSFSKSIENFDVTFSKREYDRTSLALSPLTPNKHREIMNELYIYRKYEMNVCRTAPLI